MSIGVGVFFFSFFCQAIEFKVAATEKEISARMCEIRHLSLSLPPPPSLSAIELICTLARNNTPLLLH